MINIKRKLDLSQILEETSCFLFGPRGTGKSSLIPEGQRWKLPHRHIALQDPATFMKFSRDPDGALRDYFSKYSSMAGTVFIIDDIHRLPALLDAAYRLSDSSNARFLFVTSSKHKLLRNGGRLRPGCTTRTLHPLSANEIGADNFDLEKALEHGLLPAEYNRPRNEDAGFPEYVSLYLQEEIAQSAGAGNIPGFFRLLIAIGKRNGELINYTDLATQTGLPRTTVQEYVRTILATGMAYELPAWTQSSLGKAIRTSKSYLFDTGVARYLQMQDPHASPSANRAAPFQHWVMHELRCLVDALPSETALNHWRSTGGHSVDFILNSETAIAVNGTIQAGKQELKGLGALRKEGLLKRYLLVCREPAARTVDGIEIWPYKEFVQQLWGGELV